MKRLIQTSKLCLVVWLCLFSTVDFRVLSNTVICFERDGHVSLEIADGGKCAPPINAGQNVSLGAVAHCAQCTDLVITQPAPNIPIPQKTFAFQIFHTPSLNLMHVLPTLFLPSRTFAFHSSPSLGERIAVSRRIIVILV